MTVFKYVLLILAFSCSSALQSQERPNLKPTRDVMVTYRTTGGAGTEPVDVRMEWSQELLSLRMDVPDIGWSVADHRTGKGFIVMQEERRIMDMPAIVHASQLGPSPDASLVKEGTARIAGLGCTQWRYRDQNGQGTICLTEDGLMLQIVATQSGITGGSEAIAVSYVPQDKARFMPPEGYVRVQPRQPRNRPQP